MQKGTAIRAIAAPGATVARSRSRRLRLVIGLCKLQSIGCLRVINLSGSRQMRALKATGAS